MALFGMLNKNPPEPAGGSFINAWFIYFFFGESGFGEITGCVVMGTC